MRRALELGERLAALAVGQDVHERDGGLALAGPRRRRAPRAGYASTRAPETSATRSWPAASAASASAAPRPTRTG